MTLIKRDIFVEKWHWQKVERLADERDVRPSQIIRVLLHHIPVDVLRTFIDHELPCQKNSPHNEPIK